MAKFIVVGWTKGPHYLGAPAAFIEHINVKGGKLGFHCSAPNPQVFNSYGTAKRAIARSKEWDESQTFKSDWSIVRYEILRLRGV